MEQQSTIKQSAQLINPMIKCRKICPNSLFPEWLNDCSDKCFSSNLGTKLHVITDFSIWHSPRIKRGSCFRSSVCLFAMMRPRWAKSDLETASSAEIQVVALISPRLFPAAEKRVSLAASQWKLGKRIQQRQSGFGVPIDTSLSRISRLRYRTHKRARRSVFPENFAPSWLSVTQCEHGIELSVKAVKFRQPFCADSILKPADATLWMLEWLGPLCTRSVTPFGKPLAERQWTKASMIGLRDA